MAWLYDELVYDESETSGFFCVLGKFLVQRGWFRSGRVWGHAVLHGWCFIGIFGFAASPYAGYSLLIVYGYVSVFFFSLYL